MLTNKDLYINRFAAVLKCSGENIVRLRKTWHTDTPSVQGIWTPFTRLDPGLAVTSLPDEWLSRRPAADSATDYVLRAARNVRLISADDDAGSTAGESASN